MAEEKLICYQCNNEIKSKWFSHKLEDGNTYCSDCVSRRVESHQIDKNHWLYEYTDELCYKSKNLYNAVQYRIKVKKHKDEEGFKFNNSYLYKRYKELDEAKELNSAVKVRTLDKLATDWNNFFKALKKNGKDGTEKRKIKEPGFKKSGPKGRCKAEWQVNLNKDSTFSFPSTKGKLRFEPQNKDNVICASFDPLTEDGRYYNLNIIRKVVEPQLQDVDDCSRIVGIDLGIDNLATVVNNFGLRPFAINGKPLKSMNRYFNKKRAKYMQYIGGKGKSNRIYKLTRKRNNKVKTYIHKTSRKITDWCVEHNVDAVVIGKNKQWKNEINIGKVNNQKFVSIPYNMLIDQLKYKLKDEGIKVIITEEANTSEGSFLDRDPLPKYDKDNKPKRSGRRVERGLYEASDGTKINADVNAGYNIIRKVFPKTFNGIEGVPLHPVRINLD